MCMASIMLRDRVVQVGEAAGAAHTTPSGQRRACSLWSAQPLRQLYPLQPLGFRNAILLLNSSKMSEQKFPFVSFTYLCVFLEKHVTDWI